MIHSLLAEQRVDIDQAAEPPDEVQCLPSADPLAIVACSSQGAASVARIIKYSTMCVSRLPVARVTRRQIETSA
jgi:hypothetical protein